MSKAKIYEFDPVIYPRKLWVAKGGEAKDLIDVFSDRCEKDLQLDDVENLYGAISYTVIRKSDGMFGELVWFPTIKHLTVKNIGHESSHVAVNIAHDMNIRIDYENDEPFAYLIGWLCDCIDKVRTNKIK